VQAPIAELTATARLEDVFLGLTASPDGT
jgi:hypothetical protein